MNASLVVVIAVLFGTGTYLLLQRTLTRIVLGVGLLGNGVNVLILATSSRAGDVPLVGRDDTTDSVPQALILTAIVISFSFFAFLLVLAMRAYQELDTDDTDDMRVAEPADDVAPPVSY